MTSDLVTVFLSLAVLLATARLLGELARRCGFPAIFGELVAGILLGPTVFGAVAPDIFSGLFPMAGNAAVIREGLSQLGVVLFLMVAGMEVDLSTAWRQGRVAIAVSIGGMVVPFALGFGLAFLLPQFLGAGERDIRPLHYAMFFATALSISALPVIVKTLMDINLFRSDLGVVVISAAICQDLVGWISFAIVLSLIGATPGEGMHLYTTIALILLFAFGMLTAGRWLVNRILPWLHAYASWPGGVIGFVLTLTLLGAAFTEWIGVHALFGAFIVGATLGDSPHLRSHTRATLDQFVSFFFAPIFFAGIGLQVNFVNGFDPLLVIIVLVVACVGKIIGAGLAARLSGMDARESAAVGFAMNSRGAMEIILGSLALQFGVIGDRMFVALVVMALVTSLISGPAIQRILDRPKARRFVDHVSAKGFVFLSAADSDGAIRELAQKAAAIAGVDVATIGASAVQREHVMATGVGNGIAVPHARFGGLSAPIVAVGLSRSGIDFHAPDGGMAHVIVLVLTPENDHGAELELLPDISRTLNAVPMQRFLNVAGYTEFLGLLKAG
jgi:Kef-type K+ transport system membrane component KefB/mannitol/fructose-specific phosphotransferase system IIA component (Ntr-type)